MTFWKFNREGGVMSFWWSDYDHSEIDRLRRGSKKFDEDRLTSLMRTESRYIKDGFPAGKTIRVNPTVLWDVDFYVEILYLKLNVTDNPDAIYWVLTFRFHEDPAASRKVDFHTDEIFQIKLVYEINHPHKEPGTYPFLLDEEIFSRHNWQGGAYKIDRRWSVPIDLSLEEHQWPDGRLCLHSHSSTETGWDPASSTGATFMLWSIQWIRAMLRYKTTGNFPSTA
ncbi:hypothetical protein A2154_02330 [Candidatus Gottesmanbacteria bacterium RBG_16_43_7]|uniref:Uncharacterized protein n=1 Tax=Candidatus Gottesmanbacteria bacterium RBG_16_43_7 TaxID=1798373 RepID=A0A1F5Z883_9BACT|nr:MAG: hypothetical protein A2154_02330 [Candidatus Gottesmanbacteria bacterium RBG_16_43_7]